MKQVPISITEMPLTDELMEGTLVWLFWRKVLKLRNYKAIMRVQSIFKTDKGPTSELCYFFERPANKKMLCITITKYKGLWFTEACGAIVFESPIYVNIAEFEQGFKQYFYRKLPILPEKVCIIGGY